MNVVMPFSGNSLDSKRATGESENDLTQKVSGSRVKTQCVRVKLEDISAGGQNTYRKHGTISLEGGR